MIADTVEFIRTQLRGHLGAADRAVVAGPVPAPARGEAPPDVCLSLVSAEHDASARNAPRPAGRAEPPLALALLLLVTLPAPRRDTCPASRRCSTERRHSARSAPPPALRFPPAWPAWPSTRCRPASPSFRPCGR